MLLVTGSNGQLGSELKKFYNQQEAIFADRELLDISDISKLEYFFANNNINYIINAAAYTAVDQAEINQQEAYLTNFKAVENLVKIANQYNIFLVHISTDYVFDGKYYRPYLETDIVNPLSVYGKTKLEAEQIIMSECDKAIIIRTAWLYSEYGNNFVKTMIRLAKERKELNIVADQIGTPTYAYDLASFIHNIIPDLRDSQKGIYHFTNEGVASWYDFAYEIINIKNLDCKVKPIRTEDYPTKAVRPSYSVLSKQKVKQEFNIEIRHWKEALKECLKNLS